MPNYNYLKHDLLSIMYNRCNIAIKYYISGDIISSRKYVCRKELKMAEIQIEYRKLQKDIEDSIKKGNEKSKDNPDILLPEEFEAAILTCLTEKTEDNSDESWENAYNLWDVQIHTPDEIPVGDSYIKVQDVVLEIILSLIKKGVMAFLLHEAEISVTPKDLIEFGNKLIASLSSLDRCDKCLAYKAVNHPSTVYKPVSKDSIMKWFPGIKSNDILQKCDMISVEMHKSCRFFNFEDELCTISENDICEAISSLQKKQIVTSLDNDTRYKFKW